MSGNELIAVRNENGRQVVSARELHEILIVNKGKSERFSQWFNRHLQYGFEENIDFTSVKKFTVVNNGAKRELEDYAITIDMAKELSMLQKSSKGREVRKYFLECEKQVAQVQRESYLIVDPIERAKRWIEEEEERRQLALVVEKQAVVVEKYDNIYNIPTTYTITDVAKDLGMSAQKLNKQLHEQGIIFKQNGTWKLYSKYDHLVPTHFDYRIGEYGQQLRVTNKGREWIMEQLKGE